jgi:predicted metal-binding protein
MQELEDIARELGASTVKIVNPSDVIFDVRARFKCLSCKRYEKKCTCPPNIPDIDYFKMLFSSYHWALFIGIERKVKPNEWKTVGKDSSRTLHRMLLDLEKQAFNRGCNFAISFIGGSCKMCEKETCSLPCKNPSVGRIPIEAAGVNVVETSKRLDIDIRFPIVLSETFWRVGLILVT